MLFDCNHIEIHENIEVNKFLLAYIIKPTDVPKSLTPPLRAEEINEEEFSWSDPATKAVNTFANLSFTEDDQAKVYELITTIAHNSKATLLFKYKSYLEKLGDELRKNLHPLKFMYAIFSNHELKECLKDIRNDYFKWSNFKNGIVEQMRNEEAKGNFSIYAVDFAKDLQIPPKAILPYFSKEDWAGLLEFLLHN